MPAEDDFVNNPLNFRRVQVRARTHTLQTRATTSCDAATVSAVAPPWMSDWQARTIGSFASGSCLEKLQKGSLIGRAL